MCIFIIKAIVFSIAALNLKLKDGMCCSCQNFSKTGQNLESFLSFFVLHEGIESRHKSALRGVNGDRSDAFQNCFENKNRNSETLKKKKAVGYKTK